MMKSTGNVGRRGPTYSINYSTLLSLAFAFWFLGSTVADAAEHTEFLSMNCSEHRYHPGDQLKQSISLVLTQLVSEAVDRITFNNKEYRAEYPPKAPIVYAYSYCHWTFGIKGTCRSCVRAAKKQLHHGCPHKVWASVELNSCSLKYQTSPI